MNHKNHGYCWVNHSGTMLFDASHKSMTVRGNVRDIHNQKQVERGLQELNEELEEKVQYLTKNLEEVNNALKVMLKKEEEIRKEFGDKILANVKQLVLPCIEQMKGTALNSKQQKYMDMLESGISEIVSPFLNSLSSSFINLTPAEIQIAKLVKDGKTTKEIAEMLNLSNRTIEFHRASIRKKVGIKCKKKNLRSYLMSIV